MITQEEAMDIVSKTEGSVFEAHRYGISKHNAIKLIILEYTNNGCSLTDGNGHHFYLNNLHLDIDDAVKAFKEML